MDQNASGAGHELSELSSRHTNGSSESSVNSQDYEYPRKPPTPVRSRATDHERSRLGFVHRVKAKKLRRACSCCSTLLPPWLRGWGWEFAGCIGTLAILVGMWTFLLCFNNKAKPDWPNAITLNAIVAILSLTLKACMLFSISSSMSLA